MFARKILGQETDIVQAHTVQAHIVQIHIVHTMTLRMHVIGIDVTGHEAARLGDVLILETNLQQVIIATLIGRDVLWFS
jgi:hypothetical protein